MGREFLLPLNFRRYIHQAYLILGCAFLLVGASAYSTYDIQSGGQLDLTAGERQLASLPFPKSLESRDEDEILSTYSVYLEFIAAVGKSVDYSKTQSLTDKYQRLRAKDAAAAAKFLRALRFEMEQYVQLKGASRRVMNSNSEMVRNWVEKWLSTWNREVDEAFYRSVATRYVRANEKKMK